MPCTSPHGPLRALLAAATLLAVACSGEPAIPDWATATAIPADPTAATDEEDEVGIGGSGPQGAGAIGTDPDAHLGEDVRVLTFEPGQEVGFVTTEHDRSWAVAVTAAEPDTLVGIRRVRDPAGATRYAADLRAELLLIDELHPRVLADADAIGLYATSPRGEALPQGRWLVDVIGNAGPPEVRVIVRSGPTEAPQTLDVAVWSTAADVDPAAVASAWRGQMDAVLTPHDLAVGALEITAEPSRDSFSSLGIDGLADDVHRACERAAAATGAPPRAALVVLVDQIGEGVLSAAADHPHVALARGSTVDAAAAGEVADGPRRPDNDIDGFAVATPGTPVLGPPSHACVAVAARGDAPARGAVALHEILHLAGITRHTTERDGRSFDIFPDTPECPAEEHDRDGDGQVSRIECAEHGADNLMFWAAGGDQLSPDQAWHIRNHPLFRPATG